MFKQTGPTSVMVCDFEISHEAYCDTPATHWTLAYALSNPWVSGGVCVTAVCDDHLGFEIPPTYERVLAAHLEVRHASDDPYMLAVWSRLIHTYPTPISITNHGSATRHGSAP